MKISIPGISQEDFDYALECLEDCKQSDAADFGFKHPFFSPGGQYGKQWWQLDSSLNLCGYKWIDRAFCETALLNFIESQKEDGRICLWGADLLPKRVAGGNFPEQNEGVSSLPKIFDAAYHILQGSTDEELKHKTYNMLKKYADWWFAARIDKESGLITAVFEETFIPYLGSAYEYAAVDTNAEVYAALYYTARLAEELGYKDDAAALNVKREKLGESINKYLWNEEKGAFYPYDVVKKEHADCLMASTFAPLRLGIATADKKAKLLTLLCDDAHFNWNTRPLTSVSKLDRCFTTTRGKYQGNASWSGNVWTLPNETAIRGLIDSGEDELAAELAYKTLLSFKGNCTEFINPFDGSGHGVEKYGWTASQFIELIVEVIFGVSYSAAKKEITVSPKLPRSLRNAALHLGELSVSPDIKLDIHINNGAITYCVSDSSVKVVC